MLGAACPAGESLDARTRAVRAAEIASPARPLDAIAAKLTPSRTAVYKTFDGKPLELHIFEPRGHKATDRRAVFLAIHGGGWAGGDPRAFYPFADHFARLGMVGISLQYRLLHSAPDVTVFDCVRDGRSAVRYLRAHAAELGIDPERIVVVGGSAGGHIAAGTALFDGVDDQGDDISVSCRPNALVLYYPVIDTSEKGYGREKIGQRWREISPVDQVKPGMPPTIVFHGTGDTVTPFEGAERFCRRMIEAGNPCTLVLRPDGRHGYFIFDLDLFGQVMDRTEEFLRACGFLED